jgi:hypothetical protein
MGDYKYSTNVHTIAAMLTYCNVTPSIVQDITAAMSAFMNAFEAESKSIVGAHVEGYRDLLIEFKSLLDVIAGEVDDTATETRRKALLYDQVISKKIR